jgi:hypothetical protein
MKAIVRETYGPPDVLVLEEVPLPTLRDGDVLVRVHAASANAGDWHLLRGTPLPFRLVAGLRRPKFKIIGTDVAGHVEAVGRNVTQFRPGDEVFGELSRCGFGAYAEFAAAPEKALALKPANLSFEEAATIPTAGCTALQGLRKGRIQRGQRVLINGASGGVGTFAVQITERNVHPGALVGPGAGSTPLLTLHQVSRLRLVVAVPEALVGAIVKGARVPFTVPAYPGETFYGTVSLLAHDLDSKTRTMPVELEVRNPDLRLGAGMYPEVQWPVKRPQPSLLVPPTSIVTTTERTFVIRVHNGVAQWVNVGRGARVGDLIEVFGPLQEGDTIVRRGTDEIREGSKVNVQPTKAG